MKKLNKILAFSIISASLSVLAADFQNYADAMKSGKENEAGKKYENALSDADIALKLAKNDNEKVEASLLKLRVFMNAEKTQEADAVISEICGNDKLNVHQKCNAVMYAANFLCNKKKFDDSRKYYMKALDISGITPAQRSDIMLAHADTFFRDGDFKKAREDANAVLSVADIPPENIYRTYERIASYYTNMRDRELAVEFLNKADLSKLSLAQRINVKNLIAQIHIDEGNFDKAKRIYDENLEMKEITEAQKAQIYEKISSMYMKQGKDKEARESILKVLDAKDVPMYVKTNPLTAFAATAFAKNSFPDAEWAYEKIIELTGQQPEGRRGGDLVEIYWRLGKKEKAMALIDDLRKSPKTPADLRLKFTCFAFGNKLSNSNFKLADEVAKLEKEANTQFSNEQKCKMLIEAARFYFMRNDELVCRALLAERDNLLVKSPRKAYNCQFVKKAASSAAEWRISDYIKDSKNRESRFLPYGDAGTLYTDVAAVRGFTDTTKNDAKEGFDTGFYMMADSFGWHIFVKCTDPAPDDVELGIVSGGALEMYFRPGEGESYFQWIVDYPSGKTEFYDWNTTSEDYRFMKDFIKAEVVKMDDGFGVYTFIPWILMYDKLPQNGKNWDFSLCHWGRGGSVSWGGKVHEISKWGDVKWNSLSPEMLSSIRKIILFKALAEYRKAKTEAVVSWTRDIYGDKVFFDAVLKKYFEDNDEIAKKVAKNMSDAEIDMIFAIHVKDWIETPLRIQNMRADYLAEKLMKDSVGKR